MPEVTAMQEKLLEVEDLTVSFGRGKFRVVDGVSFTLGREKLGIVGESGSGKSMTGKAVLRLLPGGATLEAKRLQHQEVDLLTADERQMRDIRGRRISMILQDPKYSLNPVVRVGEQIAEACRLHQHVSGQEAAERAVEMLAAVQIREPKRVFDLYPHEISGGMGQRVMIAMMLVTEPSILIADEPTSALDVTVRYEILQLLDGLVSRSNLGVVFISHDLNLVRRFCDRVIIMYAGRIVEALAADRLEDAEHPYTRGLLAAVPRIHAPRRRLQVLTRDPLWMEAPGVRAP